MSCLELLILEDLWAGERLICEKSIPRGSRSGELEIGSLVGSWVTCCTLSWDPLGGIR